MMNSRGLSIAAVVLAILVALLYWSNHESPKSPASASVPASPKILALNQADIIKLEIKKGADDVILAKNASGIWQITSPQEFAADSSAVSNLLSAVSSLSADRLLDEKASNLQPFGLAPAAMELTINENGNKSQRLLIGDDTPTRSGAYAALAGDPRLFTIATYNKTSLDKGLNDLRDKRFLTVDGDKINRLELLTGKSQLEFDRYQDHWQIVKPKLLRADSTPIEDFVRTLTDAKIDLSQSESDKLKAASDFPKAETVGTVRIMSDAGTQELKVRKISGDYYAESSVVEAPYKVPKEIGDEFNKSLDDFRNKKLLDFGFSDPRKIEFRDGQKSYFLTKGGADWWGPDGKKMEPAGAVEFVDKLRELSADKFVDSGFAAPESEITVTASGQTEKVLISKSGENYTAKRDGDSSLYQLNAKTLQDLEQAAARMKPAAAK